MSEEIKTDLNQILIGLKAYSRQLSAMVDIVERTINNPNTTNNSAMNLIVEMKQHPWVEKSRFGTVLGNVHKALFKDANDKLAKKIAADKLTLANLNPVKSPKKKNNEE